MEYPHKSSQWDCCANSYDKKDTYTHNKLLPTNDSHISTKNQIFNKQYNLLQLSLTISTNDQIPAAQYSDCIENAYRIPVQMGQSESAVNCY